jgi:hypothetical protein
MFPSRCWWSFVSSGILRLVDEWIVFDILDESCVFFFRVRQSKKLLDSENVATKLVYILCCSVPIKMPWHSKHLSLRQSLPFLFTNRPEKSLILIGPKQLPKIVWCECVHLKRKSAIVNDILFCGFVAWRVTAARPSRWLYFLRTSSLK